jgi:hypothetical protein
MGGLGAGGGEKPFSYLRIKAVKCSLIDPSSWSHLEPRRLIFKSTTLEQQCIPWLQT